MDKMVKMPIATVKMLAKMFEGENGMNVSTILDDLGGNRDLNVINLGLLLKGSKVEVPETTYYIRDSRIEVHKLIHASVLKDLVSYRTYIFNKQEDESWKQNTYAPYSSCDFESWFNREDKLPENVSLPEIVENKD